MRRQRELDLGTSTSVRKHQERVRFPALSWNLPGLYAAGFKCTIQHPTLGGSTDEMTTACTRHILPLKLPTFFFIIFLQERARLYIFPCYKKRPRISGFPGYYKTVCHARRVLRDIVQGDRLGFNTGNGEKLSYSQAAGLAWLCLTVA